MQGLPSILLLFRSDFNKFNNTGAQILDSVYHMTLKLIKNLIWGVKMSRLCHLLRNVIMDLIPVLQNLETTSGLLILLHGVISLPDATSCENFLYCTILTLYLHMYTQLLSSSFDYQSKLFQNIIS